MEQMENSASKEQKLEALKAYLKSLGKIAVAYSSGVDSTFLLAVAIETLGKENVMAITASSHSFPQWEYQEAKQFCQKLLVKHEIVYSNEMELEDFVKNPKNRCYICKKEIFTQIGNVAEKHGFPYVAEGSNMDDNGDYRPGLIAVAELGVKSPLRFAKLYKSEIRELSQKMGLPTWKKPSFACLATRFVYGEQITKEKLGMVEEAEKYLMEKGFEQFRVRIHGMIARIEVLPEQIPHFLDQSFREEITAVFRKIGFAYVTLDLLGYRSGSMNEVLSEEELMKAQNVEIAK